MCKNMKFTRLDYTTNIIYIKNAQPRLQNTSLQYSVLTCGGIITFNFVLVFNVFDYLILVSF